MSVRRLAGNGWIALLGGGEFSFGETLDADRAWLAKVPDGPVGFLPTASGSTDYIEYFRSYLGEEFSRELVSIPVYRQRDARRAKNAQRIADLGALYVGGGIADQLLETLIDSAVLESTAQLLGASGTIAAIAAAAHAFGTKVRSLAGDQVLDGFGWLPGGVVETNFDPAHDRRLRHLMSQPGVTWGLGIPAGSAVLLGPDSAVELVGTSFLLDDADGDFQILQ